MNYSQIHTPRLPFDTGWRVGLSEFRKRFAIFAVVVFLNAAGIGLLYVALRFSQAFAAVAGLMAAVFIVGWPFLSLAPFISLKKLAAEANSRVISELASDRAKRFDSIMSYVPETSSKSSLAYDFLWHRNKLRFGGDWHDIAVMDQYVRAAEQMLEACLNSNIAHQQNRPARKNEFQDDPVERSLTSDEALLAKLFAEVLGVSKVNVNENFFEMGGHSLMAMQLVARIRQNFGVQLEVRKIFDSPTVAHFAKEIAAARSTSEEPAFEAEAEQNKENIY